MNAIVPPDILHECDLERYICGFRAFLGDDRIEAAKERMVEANADGNPFRTLVLREKQPWLGAFDEFDHLTQKGVLPLKFPPGDLRRRGPNDPLLLAAEAGKTLERIVPTLPEALKDQMRAKLLDLHGRSHPVLMEWDTAYFYLRHGFSVHWNDVNVPGPEFTCERGELMFEVECKRITRLSKERLGDRAALTLGNGIVHAALNAHLYGDILIDTPYETGFELTDVVARLGVFLDGSRDLGSLDVDVPGVGRLTGALARFEDNTPGASKEEILRRVEARDHDCRAFASAAPNPAGGVSQALVVFLRGPRRSQDEHIQHIANTANEGATQLTGNRLGLVMMELEDVEDATLYRDKAPFRQINHDIFARFPAVAAMVWRGQAVAEANDDGFGVVRQVFAERNEDSLFDATAIPLVE